MAQLHLIQNPISIEQFDHQFKLLANADDHFLFINDAVFCLLSQKFRAGLPSKEFLLTQCYALQTQCEARNLSHKLIDILQLIDYKDFVVHCQNSNKVISW